MGTKAYKRVFAVVLLSSVLLSSINVKASTATDIYDLYQLNYAAIYPDGVIETIMAYEQFLKYNTMYTYIEKSTFDTTILDKRIANLQSDIDSVTVKLKNGYDLSVSEIYALEDEYNTKSKQLYEAKQSLSNTAVNPSMPILENTPTKEQYDAAIATKKDIDSKINLGEAITSYPVKGATVKEVKEDQLLLKTKAGEAVKALYNGTVANISNNSITLYHDSAIYTLYSNLDKINVNVGDVVFQGQEIGTAKESLLLKMKVNGTLVDVSKLFKKE